MPPTGEPPAREERECQNHHGDGGAEERVHVPAGWLKLPRVRLPIRLRNKEGAQNPGNGRYTPPSSCWFT